MDDVSSDITSRLQGWVDGFNRNDHVSTWVAMMLMRDALKEINALRRENAEWKLGSQVVAERIIAPLMDAHSANAVVCSKHGPYGHFDSICPKCSAETAGDKP